MGETTKLSREHTVANPVPGLVLVAGGKLTTYRVMARDAVDHAIRDFDATPSSITDRVPLMGAWGHEARTNQRVALSRASGLEIGMIDHLLGRYGGLVDELLALIHRRPELGEPLPGAEHYLRAEVLYAVTHEGARHLDDVLARRTRVSIETFDRGIAAARPAAELMAEGAGLGRRAARGRGRPLPAAGRGGAAEPAHADRPGGRRGAGQGAATSSRGRRWTGPGADPPKASRRPDRLPPASRASATLPTGRAPGQTCTTMSASETTAPPR